MRYVLAVTLGVALLGCGKDDGSGPGDVVVLPSTYVLATIDGAALPHDVVDALSGATKTILADTVGLGTGGIFTEQVHYREAGTAHSVDANGSFTMGTADTTHFSGGILNGSGSAPRRALTVHTIADALHGAHLYGYRRISP